MRAVNSFFVFAGCLRNYPPLPLVSFVRTLSRSFRLFGLAGVAAVILCSSTSIASALKRDELQVIRSDQRSFLFEYMPQINDPLTIREGGKEYSLFNIPHGVVMPVDESEGHPDLRYRSISLAFPDDRGNIVQIVEADYEDIPGVDIAPVPGYRVKDGLLEVREYRPDPAVYSTNAYVPEQPVQLSAVEQVRGMLIGAVRVWPVQYNPATRTLRKYSRMVVEVLFANPRPGMVRAVDDPLLKNVPTNYQSARDWQIPRNAMLGKRVGPSVLALGFWYRIPITTEGVYILDAAYLESAGLDLSEIDPRTIKIYGNGGTEVPELVTATRTEDLVENAIYVQGEADGVFNDGDFIIFFGRSTRNWSYNPATKLFGHSIHHYSETNYYWLTYGGLVNGKRMVQQASLSDPATVIPDRFTGLVMVNEDTINLLGSGREWFGPSINANSTTTYARTLSGLLTDSARTYRYSFIARSKGVAPTLIVKEGSTLLAQTILSSILISDDYTVGKERTITVTSNAPITNGSSQVSFTYNTSDIAGSGWLNWMEIQYPRNFQASANYLRFRSPDTSGVVEYRLSGFTASPFILDVTAPEGVKIITGATGSYTFRALVTADTIKEYCAVASGAYKVPAAMQFVPNQNLRGITEGYDFIIVTSKEYKSASDRLAAFREQPEHGNLRTLVVDVEHIYNEFSGGLADVTAIRDFLKYAYDNWSRPPSFVLFFGQGSYDYKARLGFRSSYVPSWQSPESLYDLASYTSDDFFVRFSSSSAAPFLSGGRLNPRTTADADAVVDKLIAYEVSSARDPWKLRILFVADDSWTSEGEDGSIHTSQAESLAENTVPPELEKRKVYIAEYPTVITAQGRRKPGAYQAIIDEINRGVLIVNFTGHGNPSVWTHESIFTVQTSIPSLVNADRLPIFFQATCNFSQFDDPNRYTGSELLINKTDGGSIASVSATRKVFAVENFNLNVDIYERMFLTDQFGRAYLERPATALYRAKFENTNSINDQKFFYMGDPSMRLQYPAGFGSIDSVNREPVDSVNGAPRSDSDPIQIMALQKVTIKGVVRDSLNMPDNATDATMTLVVNDATRQISIAGFPPNSPTPFTYAATGSTIFRGSNSISQGAFGASFVVPKDISYADSTTRGRLVAYYSNSETDGVAYTGKVFVGGTDSSSVPDSDGPEISLFLDSRSFRAGDLVSDDPTLIVDLLDSSGINTSLSGIGHRLEAWVNNSALGIDITDFYTSALDDYQRGTVQYQMKDLPYGRNTLRVRAWDAFNNATVAETFFDVTSGDKLTISDVMNYPNPFSRETAFTFRQNQIVPLNVSIKIYTVAGRLIQTLDASVAGEPFIQVPWDGRDRDGDVLGNGVYLYKVVVSTVDGRYSSEALGKLSVLK
jgi:hypothetical protein